MNLFKDEHYQTEFTKYKFPSHNAKIKKDDTYALKFFKAMFSAHVRDVGSIRYSRRGEFSTYRLYAEGNQPVSKYMNQLCPFPDDAAKDLNPGQTLDNSKREGWMNISWDILSVAPKFERIFVGMFEKVEHDIVATSINDSALKEKEDFQWNLWAQKMNRDYFESIDRAMAVRLGTPEWIPDTIQELQMYMSESFKTKLEIAIEMGLDYSFYMSKWNEIKKKLFEDWFRLGIAACQDYVEDKKVLVRYLDPARLILPFSREKDFSDIGYWGYIDEWNIAKLRERSGLDEKEIFKIARAYDGYLDNKMDESWEYVDKMEAGEDLPYDTWKVQMLYGEYICSELKKIKTVQSESGADKLYVNKGVPDSEWMRADRQNRSVETQRYQTTKKGYWVVGTDVVIECGDCYCIPREGKKTPKLSLNAHRYSNKSILSSIIPNLDSIQLAWLKLQNSKAMAAPDGLAIEVGTLENISIDGKTMSPLEILTIKRQTGDTLYRATTHEGAYSGGNPVTRTAGGIGEQLDEWIRSIDYDLTLIRQQTGMNEAIDASSPTERTPVKTSEMAANAANNALQPVYSGYVALKEGCARKMTSRYQNLALNGDLKIYYPSLGKNLVRVFEITSGVSHEDYAIKLRARPTDDMKNSMRQTVLAAQQLGTKQGGISHSDALYLEEKIESGNLKYARMFIAYKEKFYEQQNAAISQQMQAQNGQNAQDVEVTKAQALLELDKQRSDLKKGEETHKTDEEIRKAMAIHEMKMREISAQGDNKIADTQTKTHGEIAKTYAQSDVEKEQAGSVVA